MSTRFVVVRVDVLGVLEVSDGERAVSGRALGGRRAQVALVALALADGPLPARRLADIVWGADLPTTWQVGLRGVVAGLRRALAELGAGEQGIVQTVPAGYRLAPDVTVDVRSGARTVRDATELLAQGRPAAALELVEELAGAGGDQLLPGEDADWLASHRRAVDALGLAAAEVASEAAGELGEHGRALSLARRTVAANPLDERAHRMLIRALDRSGDRAGAVQAYEQCRAALADQLGVDPSAETVHAYLAALREQPALSAARLPSITSLFVAREDELARVRDALRRPGLVTVAGRGGVGKSRLVVQAAGADLEPGVPRYWISLASVADDAFVTATIALQLGVPIAVDEPTAALVEHLAPIGRAVLFLDGCEAVRDATASLVFALIGSCPALTVAVTTRVPLGVDGEVVVALQPLPQPTGDDPAALAGDAQIRILLDRVRAGGGELALDDASAALLARLCRGCGGLPLALELAAAQLTAVPVGDLLDQLAEIVDGEDDRLRRLARTSYAMLDDDEAAVFRRFAVLDGSVPLPVVRAVVAGGAIPAVRVVRILRELAARGLITVDRSGPRWHYSQDDDLHHLARELLVAAGAERAAFDRLADAVCALLPDDPRDPPAPYQDELTGLLGSVRSLFAAAIDDRADRDRCLELAFRLHRYWAATNVAEGRFWLARLLAATPDSEWTRYATYALGYLSYWAGDTDPALRDLRAAVTMFDGRPEPYLARATIYIAGLLDDMDRPAEALDYVHRAISAAEPHGADLRVAAAMGVGSVLAERGDPSAADYALAAIELCRAHGSAEQLAAAAPTAAMVCWQVGSLDRARAFVTEARPLLADSRRIAHVVMLSAAAGIALAEADPDAAVDLGRIASREADELGVEREVPLIRAVLARSLLARGERAEAAQVCASAVRTAARMAVTFPLALCLETAALVRAGSVPGPEVATDLAALLASAAAIRARGDRPPPATLRAEVDRLRDTVGAGAALDGPDAAGLALTLLEPIAAPAR